MPNHLIEFFEDEKLTGKIKRHLPFFTACRIGREKYIKLPKQVIKYRGIN
jgi:hypothetical protein